MTSLYNCHTDGDNWRITKFNDLGNPESSYLVDHSTCQCPAGERPTCRHRTMLPLFLHRGFINDFHFYDYDRGGWVTNEPARMIEPRSGLLGDQQIERTIEQDQAYNRAVMAAGGTITTNYMRDGSIETEITIPHEGSTEQRETNLYLNGTLPEARIEAQPKPSWRRL